MGRWSRRLGDAFIDFAGIDDGARVLDVGCGTGALSASLLSEHPHVTITGIDPSAAFVAAARARLSDKRHKFEVGDAQGLRFGTSEFDAVVSMLVLNFVPDPARALAEFRRVVRPGGRVAACVWDYDEMAMLRTFWDAAQALDPTAASIHERLMPLGRKGELEALWRSAGVRDVEGRALAIEARFDSFRDYWEPFLAGVGPAGGYAASLPLVARAALHDRLLQDVWKGDGGRAVTLPARAWAVRGIVP